MALINGYIYVAQATEDGAKNFKMLTRLIDKEGKVSYDLSYVDNFGSIIGPEEISIDEIFDLVSGMNIDEAKQRTIDYYDYWNNQGE